MSPLQWVGVAAFVLVEIAVHVAAFILFAMLLAGA